MAHQVKLNLNTNVVGSKDVSIDVSGSSGKLGKLLVSKGNIEWLPSPKSKNKHRLTWAKFAKLMEDQGKPAKVRAKKKAAAKKVVPLKKAA